jgi:hypothetical protein
METQSDHSHHTHTKVDSDIDYWFLMFLVLIVVAVTWLGVMNFTEGRKTEVAKQNGEAWVEWLTEQGTQRFEPDYKIEACKGGVKPATAPDPKSTDPVLGTWGACFDYIMKNTELKDQVNTFFNKPPEFIEKCDPNSRAVMGAIVIEDLMPTPAGSAIPFVGTQLINTDPIDYKMQLRVSVCDKGGYPIKVAEFDF